MSASHSPAFAMTAQTSPVRAARAIEAGHSYRVSSFELRDGLEVAALAVDSLPAEVLREFQRLRGCWAHTVGPDSSAAVPLLLRRAGVAL
jgi:hypothetical protein